MLTHTKTQVKPHNTSKSRLISPLEFAKYILGLNLYPKQQSILESIWNPGVSHAVMCLGRRSGKTLIAVVSALYAGFILHRHYKTLLGARKYYVIYLVSNSLSQSRMILKIMRDVLMSDHAKKPQAILKGRCLLDLVASIQSDRITLKNGCTYVATPASSRGVRGEASPVILFDEIAFTLDTEGNSAGDSLYAALAPSTAQFGEYSRIIMLSSPWIDSGIFYEFYQKGLNPKFNDVLSFQHPTWEVNPSISPRFLALEKERNPDIFDVEYGAQFAIGSTRFIHPDLIDAAIDTTRPYTHYAKPDERYKYAYSLALDPAKGGTGRDSYVACLCHYESRSNSSFDSESEQVLVVDFWHEFNASLEIHDKNNQITQVVSGHSVAEWIRDIESSYGLATCQLDQYNSLSIIEELHGWIDIKEFTWTEKTQTTAFRKLAELFIGNRIQLPNDKTAIKQLKNLKEIRKPKGFSNFTGGNGSAVDDYCFALAMAAANAPKDDGGFIATNQNRAD